MKLNDLKWFVVYIALLLVLVPFALLPLRFSVRLGALMGSFLYYLLGKWRRIGIETLSSLLPYLAAQPSWDCRQQKPGAVIRDVFRNTGILLAELSKLFFGLDAPLMKSVEFRGLEHYETARNKGNGIIVITAHSGNWELMALAFGATVSPVAVVARNMKKGYFDRILERIRLRHGNKVIYRDSGVKEMLLFLRENGTIGILPDQVVKPPHGILADFMGKPAWTTAMPAKLAIKTGCALLPFFIHREGERNIITIYPEIEPKEALSENERILDLTTRMNQSIEEHIIRHPSQWNWLYRRWKGTGKMLEAMKQRQETINCVRA